MFILIEGMEISKMFMVYVSNLQDRMNLIFTTGVDKHSFWQILQQTYKNTIN